MSLLTPLALLPSTVPGAKATGSSAQAPQGNTQNRLEPKPSPAQPIRRPGVKNKYLLLEVYEILRPFVATAKATLYVNFMTLSKLFNLSRPPFPPL